MSNQEHIQQLAEIRSLMEKSTRFLSLSGLSGVAAGTFALLGAIAAYQYLDISILDGSMVYYVEDLHAEKWGMTFAEFLLLDGFVVITLALSFGTFFTMRRANRKGQKIWNSSSKRLAMNLAIPLVAGGLFCVILLLKNISIGLVGPLTLIFYGLALVNGSKYTLEDIRYLGIAEIILGLIAAWFWGYGLLFWAIGFGVLHIVYGLRMYFKYEK